MGLYNHSIYARGSKLRIKGIEGSYDRYCVNKDADQQHDYLRLCFRIYAKGKFSHDEATMTMHDVFEKLKSDMLPVALLPVFCPYLN